MPKRLLLALAVLGALLVPSQAVAAPKPAPTTGIDFDFVSFTQYGPATFHVDDLRLQMVSADTACWYLTLSGDPIWKDVDGDGVGEWLVQSQDPSVYPFSIQGACWPVSLTYTHSLRSGSYLGPVADCEAGTVNLTQFQPGYAVLLVFGLGMVNPPEGPLGEEPAWRGFVQPRLQSKWSPLASAALLALLATIWHLPLVFMPQFDLGLPDIATTLLVTFWYAWLFNRTGGSVLLTLIAHVTEGSVNVKALWLAGPAADRMAWTWLIAWALLVVALLIFDRKSWRTAPESAIDRVPGRIA